VRLALGLGLLLAACAGPRPPAHPHGHGSVDPHLLRLGPARLRGQELRLREGEIARTSSGERLDPGALPGALDAVELIAIGESHAHRQHHAIQVKLIEALRARAPTRPLLIGMEMFEPSQQPALDDYVAGRIDERELVRRSRWYDAWGFDFRYYREILRLARRERLPVIALNAPSAIVRKVGRGGLRALSAGERAELPREIWLGSDEHRLLFRALLGIPVRAEGQHASSHGHDPHRGLLATMLQAQVVRDETMAEGALAALAAHPGARIVLLAGSGHLSYGLGIELRLARRAPALRQATLLCLSTDRAGGELRVARGIAAFVWATAPGGRAMRYPSLGILLDAGLRIERLAPHGAEAARRADLRPEDVILAVDGRPVADRAELRSLLEEKDWGDSVELRLRRGREELTRRVCFER
jgi:uncharacterized iron-regulated protein